MMTWTRYCNRKPGNIHIYSFLIVFTRLLMKSLECLQAVRRDFNERLSVTRTRRLTGNAELQLFHRGGHVPLLNPAADDLLRLGRHLT